MAEIPFPMVSKEVEEQVHSIQGSSSANPVNSGRRAELSAALFLVQDKSYILSQTWPALAPEFKLHLSLGAGGGVSLWPWK